MNKPLLVLIVEDSEDDVLLMVRALKDGGYEPEYLRVETAEAMRSVLREKTWDVILSDYRLPRFDGLAAIALLKETDLDIPLIVVSGAIGEETAVECMRSGAQDYVMKGNISRLASAVDRELKHAVSRVQRRRADEELKVGKAQLSNALEIARLGHWEYDTANDLFTFNDQFYKLFHTTVENVGGYTMHSAEYAQRFVHADDREVVREEIQKSIESTDPHFSQQIEHRILYADGTVGYVSVRVFVVKDSQGRTVRTYGVNQDITERKRAEEALRESEKKYRTIFENSIIGVSQALPDGRLIAANAAYARMYGYANVEELMVEVSDIGRQFYADPEEREKVLRILTEKGIMEPREVNVVRRDGSRFTVLAGAREFRDPKGDLLYYQAEHVDISDRKKAEKQLQDTLESLRKAFGAIIQVMVSAVEARDPYTAGHQIRSAELARAIAMEMGLPQGIVDGIRMVGSIHDIGKLSVPAEILSKPSKLSEIEFFLIKEHARSGYEILKDVESPWPLAEMIYQHHERMDGSGYPRNLKGDEILMEARILAVADVVESMASHRPYRPALGIDKALEEISKNRGILYDSEAADACLRLFNEKGYKFE
jgi:PAS domain S-box-containing protein